MTVKIDALHRIVIPKIMRKQLHINDFDLLNIEVVDKKIIIKKQQDKMKDEKLNNYINNLLGEYSNPDDDINIILNNIKDIMNNKEVK